MAGKTLVTEPRPAPDPQLDLVRLEQEVRSLRYQLEVKDEALRALNRRLVEAELDVTRRVDEARQQMAVLLGPVWAVVTRLSRARQRLFPDESRRGRWWRSLYGRLTGRRR